MLESFHSPCIAHGIEHFEADIDKVKSMCIVMDWYENRDLRVFLSTKYKQIKEAPIQLRQKWML